ncbi:hypothetical protein QYE76_013403 [Lolium multiflorum]|uniref:Uncharacterized protein n=1 Tax=Lolium multiflorum TaxID=4521 RepID=A0AAD8X4T7_LOLMU|nr:hypothetical protein QYE76_013403 [Lolium multiflorum]
MRALARVSHGRVWAMSMHAWVWSRGGHGVFREVEKAPDMVGLAWGERYVGDVSPDISFAVSKLSRFVSRPGDVHWHALERVLRYLKGTASYGIHYTGYPRVLEGYSDANWISDADETKATSGYLFTLGGGAVSWKSCKQTIITRSTMKAELTALDTPLLKQSGFMSS